MDCDPACLRFHIRSGIFGGIFAENFEGAIPTTVRSILVSLGLAHCPAD